MIFDKLKETYALSDQGIRGAKWGTFWTCVTPWAAWRRCSLLWTRS